MLLPHIPDNFIIIMDNATEETTFPKANARKENLRKRLDDNEIPWGADMLKPELYALCKSHELKPDYKIDKIA